MAIDTAAKRASCLGLALLALRTGVIPDGSDLSASQRLHTNGLYSGIAAGVIVTIDPEPLVIEILSDGRVITIPTDGRVITVCDDDRVITIGVKP